MADKSKETLIDNGFAEKNKHLLDCLEKLFNLKMELEKAGFNLNENITVDQEKWNSYFGL